MAQWAPRRFWTGVSVAAVDGGFSVRLDDRPVRTPAKALLVLPSRALADAITREWSAQTGRIDPQSMPFTRAANSAVDMVSQQFDAVAGLVAAYGESDLLCYRATAPDALIRIQADAWDPMLDWADDALGARLRVTAGIVPVPQPAEAAAALAGAVRAHSAFGLTALHDLVALSGSLVIGLAATAGAYPPEALWAVSRIDEDWQASQWGADEEASATAARKRTDFLQAVRFWQLLQAQ